MKLFKSSSIEEDIRYPATCRIVKELKQGSGRDNMCTLVEEYAEKRAQEVRAETARETGISLIQAGISNEIIRNATKLSDAEIEELRREVK